MLDLFGDPVVEEQEEQEVKPPSLFDCINALLSGKDIRERDPELRSFDAFMVGKALMQDRRTIPFAQMMNANIDAHAQYLFYLYGLPNIRGRAKWAKKLKNPKVDKLIEEGYTERQAKDILYVRGELNVTE